MGKVLPTSQELRRTLHMQGPRCRQPMDMGQHRHRRRSIARLSRVFPLSLQVGLFAGNNPVKGRTLWGFFLLSLRLNKHVAWGRIRLAEET